MNIKKIAQIGYGQWGPNLTRAFNKLESCEVSLLVDSDNTCLDKAKKLYPSCKTSNNFDSALDPSIDALIISTPANTHYEIAKKALLNGKHLFVEKPLTTSYQEALELLNLAEKMRLQIMVGHVFLFHEALRYLKKQVSQIGDLLYFSSSRQNFGKLRDDVNAWWNLAPHDISMMLYLKDGEMPASISAQGSCFLHPSQEDFANACLTWSDGTIGRIDVNWYSAERVRKFTLAGSKETIVFDDNVTENKITHYPNRITKQGSKYLYHREPSFHPELQIKEPLLVEAGHFISCISSKESCITGAKHACDVVKILESGSESIKKRGATIEINVEQYQNSTCRS